MIDTLRQTINSQNATIALLQKSMDRLHSAYDKAVKERDDLNGRMNRSNQETFGSKSLKQSDRGKVVKNDCQKDVTNGPQKMTMTIMPLPLLHLLTV